MYFLFLFQDSERKEVITRWNGEFFFSITFIFHPFKVCVVRDERRGALGIGVLGLYNISSVTRNNDVTIFMTSFWRHHNYRNIVLKHYFRHGTFRENGSQFKWHHFEVITISEILFWNIISDLVLFEKLGTHTFEIFFGILFQKYHNFYVWKNW